ncbi:uncharacterized protein C8R40DRAFT_1068591 [Lentinula edodes]|uniref:uncharacterized protein n=1 Tax=Lentinula edodes TaxID=5353 RepID=UPI001E8D3CFC|nr:uncharacterized protein C8R40DRAFT_1068591 [Lentinula edodes]KAH7876842.1 hypothetical protein C8R40DRAFT_1068591 [Lentinula edodes]
MELDGSHSTALVETHPHPSQEEREYHPLFSSPDAEVVLAAKNDSVTKASVFFRLHSHNLKTASGFFREMFMLPQNSQLENGGVFYLEEDASTLELLFRMISGLPIPQIDSYDQIDPLLDSIEKYDTPGPLSIVRLLVMTPLLLGQPFRLYAIACRFGWDTEARHASTQTLTFDLYNKDVRPYLSRLSSNALLRLFDLHRTRREGLRQRLNDPPFVSGGLATCNNCNAVIDYHTWRELKYKIILEMDVRPAGDTILEHGLSEWPEALACWQAKCAQAGCSRALYDKGETLRVIRECIETLPKTI